jgi:hypothetical protein
MNGKRLEFDTGGVRGGNELFRDRLTGSSWQQSTTTAISGPLEGKHLPLYPFLLTPWSEWQRLHPGTLVLKPLPGYADRIPQMNAVLARGVVATAAAPKGALRQDDRLPPHTPVVGLEVNGAGLALPTDALRQTPLVNTILGGTPILVVHQSDTDTSTAFDRRYHGRTLAFTAAKASRTRLEDRQTHSTWDAYGHCLTGPLHGATLTGLILEPEYWFAWSEFHPETAIFTPAKP